MRVKIESTGGFTGRQAVVALYDTAALPAGPAVRIREAVDALAAAQARGDEGEVGADLPAYRITVSEGGDASGAGGAGEETRVYEVRGDPATGVASVLGTLLAGPDAAGPDAT
ncbi:protealysin inhibitor emfourin [Spirillospora sp. NPDC048819]|uniref:protealysin inhibitor emfourin n=1 Tax=Spirillospora sp. NPDC048819 TaxID=3155268 RepID=UPI0033DF3CCC